jgi:anti-anti-sigma factor
MKVEFDSRGEYSVIKVFGEVDISNFKVLEESIADYKELSFQKVLFDFSELEYIDSSGVGVLVRLFRAVDKNEGSVGIAGCRECIEKNFRLLKLDNFFAFFSTVEEALV